MSIDEIANLSINPIFSAKILSEFLANYKEPVMLPLIYLVLPMVYYEPTRLVLAGAQKNRSSIRTLFIESKGGMVSLAGIERRYKEYAAQTNKALIVLGSEEKIEISRGMIFQSLEKYFRPKHHSTVKQYYNAARGIGYIFSKSSIIDIFTELGVKTL